MLTFDAFRQLIPNVYENFLTDFCEMRRIRFPLRAVKLTAHGFDADLADRIHTLAVEMTGEGATDREPLLIGALMLEVFGDRDFDARIPFMKWMARRGGISQHEWRLVREVAQEFVRRHGNLSELRANAFIYDPAPVDMIYPANETPVLRHAH